MTAKKQHVDINVPMDEFTIAAIDALRGTQTRQEYLVLELTKIQKTQGFGMALGAGQIYPNLAIPPLKSPRISLRFYDATIRKAIKKVCHDFQQSSSIITYSLVRQIIESSAEFDGLKDQFKHLRAG